MRRNCAIRQEVLGIKQMCFPSDWPCWKYSLVLHCPRTEMCGSPLETKAYPRATNEEIRFDKEVFSALIKEMTRIDSGKRPSVEEILMNHRYKGLH